MSNSKTIAGQLADTHTQMILEELGIAQSDPKIQARILADMGELLMKRITLEILKAIPESEHGQFDELMDKGDPDAWKGFLDPLLGDSDAFINDVVAKEIAALCPVANELPVNPYL